MNAVSLELFDIVTNDHNYEQAITVRKDDNKCGEEAIFLNAIILNL